MYGNQQCNVKNARDDKNLYSAPVQQKAGKIFNKL